MQPGLWSRRNVPIRRGKKKEGIKKIYYENGNLRYEITFKNGKTISGYFYDDGKKTKMTNAHLQNFTKDM